MQPILTISAKFDPANASLLITEPYFDLPNLQEVYDQFIFEEYEFASYHRCTRESSQSRQRALLSLIASPAAAVIPYGTLFGREKGGRPECMLIIDCGFSYTHTIPILEGEIVWSAVRRWAPKHHLLLGLL